VASSLKAYQMFFITVVSLRLTGNSVRNSVRNDEDCGNPVGIGLGCGIRTYDNAPFAHFCTRRRCQIRMFDGLTLFPPSCTSFSVRTFSFLLDNPARPMYSHELLLDVQSSAADKNAEMMLKLSLNQMESIKGREGLQGKDADRAMSAVKLAAGGKLEEEVSVCTSESAVHVFSVGPI
jgi:hypothetical protein